MNLFLSASVPLPTRHREFFDTADVIAIREAVKALVETALDDAVLVFGGHPAITPLIALLLRGMAPKYKRRVVLFQSAFFEGEFVEENTEFIDFQIVPADGDRERSLVTMRDYMLRSRRFDAAFFIGGMEGIWNEYRAFRALHPGALCFPIASTGAASLQLFREIAPARRDLLHELTYPTLFRNLLAEIRRRQ
ncbi:hypothetical protein LRC39_17620 [Rhodopseudomonas sp. P1]|uniref:SLOG domain-containing protein n=1 Tax=Rhodopseudomonas sp. P1 TaxID=3434357 RepID=UPI0031FC2696